jgi:ATP-dependent Lhr-like helicase
MPLTASELFLGDFGDFTEIQKLAMSIIASGKNCLIVAPTGSGKTEAAMVPLLDRISAGKLHEGIAVIYITPLKALNRDMFKRLDVPCRSLGISLSVRHGDTKQGERETGQECAGGDDNDTRKPSRRYS